MNDTPDPAHVLFPGDAPAKPTEAPEWFKAQTAAATSRLMGGGKGKGEKATEGEKLSDPAGDNGEDAADKIFDTENKSFDEGVVTEFLEPFTLGAFGDGDEERGEALKSATSALAKDFKAAGTDTQEAEDAFAAFREANDHITPPSDEQIEADMVTNLATLQDELGSSFESDLSAARAFIADLETVAPGTLASLEHNGAGNDMKLVRAAIKEAKRRGY